MSFRLTRDAQQELTEVRRYTVQRWEQEQLTKYLQNLCGTVELQVSFRGKEVCGKERMQLSVQKPHALATGSKGSNR